MNIRKHEEMKENNITYDNNAVPKGPQKCQEL